MVMLEVGHIKPFTKFQVIDGKPSYHILLGHPWIHLHHNVPSTWHQCVKSSFRGKDIEVLVITAPFDASEAHLVDATMFDEFTMPKINAMQLRERVQLKASRGKENVTAVKMPHLTQAFKRPKEQDAASSNEVRCPKLQKEHLPSREIRWRVL